MLKTLSAATTTQIAVNSSQNFRHVKIGTDPFYGLEKGSVPI